MKRNITFFTLSVWVLGSMYLSAAAADVDRTFAVPVLTVSGTAPVGNCQFIRFRLTRKAGSRDPLVISIEEDTPGGAGDSVRASVWMAAMVTALDRLDDLSGVTISLRLSGEIDGPSAGGVICLAIMSALDGRDLPADCMFTGMIMPDGTIGDVGGLPQKLQAAAKSGAKRILVPAHLRFELDPNTGKEIDLKRLATDLKMEFVPVESIGDAYVITHKLSPSAPKRIPRDVLDLPTATEEWLKTAYQRDLEKGTNLWNTIPEDLQKGIVADPSMNKLFADSYNTAQSAFRSGRLLYAQQTMMFWRVGLEARVKNEKLYGALTGTGPKENLAQLDAKHQEMMQAMPDPWNLLSASSKELPDSGTQFCAQFYDNYGLVGIVLRIEQKTDEINDELKKLGANDGDKRKQLMNQLSDSKAYQLWTDYFIGTLEGEEQPDAKEIAGTVPPCAVKPDAASVEHLFYSANLSMQNSFKNDVIKAFADVAGVSEDKEREMLSQHDDMLNDYSWSTVGDQMLHRACSEIKDEKQRRFALAAAAEFHATNIATASGLIARWSTLDATFDDQGILHYGRTDRLNYLLNTARDTALTNIAVCKGHRLICVQAISDFEDAEMCRDDNNQDKISVLVTYWKASLEAKAFLMLMANDSSPGSSMPKSNAADSFGIKGTVPGFSRTSNNSVVDPSVVALMHQLESKPEMHPVIPSETSGLAPLAEGAEKEAEPLAHNAGGLEEVVEHTGAKTLAVIGAALAGVGAMIKKLFGGSSKKDPDP